MCLRAPVSDALPSVDIMDLASSKHTISSNVSRPVRLDRISAALTTGRCSGVSVSPFSPMVLHLSGELDLQIWSRRRTSFDGIKSSRKSIVVTCLEGSRADESVAPQDAFESSISDQSPDITRNVAGGFIHDEVHSHDSASGQGGGPAGGSGEGGGPGDGGGDGGGEGSGEENEDEEYGSLLNAEQIQRELDIRGVVLPPDMVEAAKYAGIRELLLQRYFELQKAPWPLGPTIVTNKIFRNRMLADPSFLFKLGTEIAIATGCATVAEIEKRGEHFWNEFELYASDMLVGIAFDIALVGLMAPFVTFGAPSSTASSTRARLSRFLQALPSNMFEAQTPGRTFTPFQRMSTLFYKALQYGVAGFGCGFLGQGVASSVMTMKRKLRKRDAGDDREVEVEVPDVVKTAAVWSLFMATSSNVRYQVVTGLESAVERSIIGKRMPQAALLFTVGVRFANNIYGGMQFVDWARWAGVQ